MAVEKVNLAQKFEQFTAYWSPHVAGRINNYGVKLSKLQGEFVWHKHDETDEMFLVVKGQLLIKLRDQDIWLNEGEFVVIPRGVEHLPVAENEVHVMFIEPEETLNTGNVENERTIRQLGTI